jgi:hypothetical protein
MSSMMQKLLSATVAFVISLILPVGLFVVTVNGLPGGMQSHDSELRAYVALTIPFSLLTVVAGQTFLATIEKRSWFVHVSFILFCSMAISVLGGILASQIMWSVMREIDLVVIPIIRLWAIGAMAGLAYIIFIDGHSLFRRVSFSALGPVRLSQILVLSLFELPVAAVILILAPFILRWTIFREPQVFLIPQNYQGPVLIVYDQPNGQPPKYEGRARVYDVPSNGILLTQFSKTKLVYHLDFYYVDEQGNRTPITFPESSQCDKSLPEDAIIVCPVGFHVGPTLDGFLIGRVSDLEAHREAFEQLFLSTFPPAKPP